MKRCLLLSLIIGCGSSSPVAVEFTFADESNGDDLTGANYDGFQATFTARDAEDSLIDQRVYTPTDLGTFLENPEVLVLPDSQTATIDVDAQARVEGRVAVGASQTVEVTSGFIEVTVTMSPVACDSKPSTTCNPSTDKMPLDCACTSHGGSGPSFCDAYVSWSGAYCCTEDDCTAAQLKDGCCDVDTDKDGIADVVDPCPDVVDPRPDVPTSTLATAAGDCVVPLNAPGTDAADQEVPARPLLAAFPSGDVLIAGLRKPALPLETANDPTTSLYVYRFATHRIEKLALETEVPHADGTATTLLDGRILIAGGFIGGDTTDKTEIVEQQGDTFTIDPSAAGPMTTPRATHAALRLPDGRVLVTGGEILVPSLSYLFTAELFNPNRSLWTPVGPLPAGGNQGSGITLAQTERGALVSGGITTNGLQANFESGACFFDADTETFYPTQDLQTAAYPFVATSSLSTEVVMGVGRYRGMLPPLGVFRAHDPDQWLPPDAPKLAFGGDHMTGLGLPNETGLITGGLPDPCSTKTAAASDVDLLTITPGSDPVVTSQPSMLHGRGIPSMALLPDGSVLIVGGEATCSPVAFDATVERYFPAYDDVNSIDVDLDGIVNGIDACDGTADICAPCGECDPLNCAIEPGPPDDDSVADFPEAISHHALVAERGYLYKIGGQDAGGLPVADVTRAKLDGSGGIPEGAWDDAISSGLPVALTDLAAVAHRGVIVAVGGRDSTLSPTDAVYVARVNLNGNIEGGWLSAEPLNIPRAGHALIRQGSDLYAVGGTFDGPICLDGCETRTVERASFNPENEDIEGVIGPWAIIEGIEKTNPLPGPMTDLVGFATPESICISGEKTTEPFDPGIYCALVAIGDLVTAIDFEMVVPYDYQVTEPPSPPSHGMTLASSARAVFLMGGDAAQIWKVSFDFAKISEASVVLDLEDSRVSVHAAAVAYAEGIYLVGNSPFVSSVSTEVWRLPLTCLRPDP